eukprot:2096995-Prymnesium_polylepis.3
MTKPVSRRSRHSVSLVESCAALRGLGCGDHCGLPVHTIEHPKHVRRAVAHARQLGAPTPARRHRQAAALEWRLAIHASRRRCEHQLVSRLRPARAERQRIALELFSLILTSF